MAMSTTHDDQSPPAAARTEPRPSMEHGAGGGADRGSEHSSEFGGQRSEDVQRDVLAAVQRALAANWTDDLPRVAVIERNGMATVYVSTTQVLGPAVRLDVRGAVRAALAPYTKLAPYTNAVFLRRIAP